MALVARAAVHRSDFEELQQSRNHPKASAARQHCRLHATQSTMQQCLPILTHTRSGWKRWRVCRAAIVRSDYQSAPLCHSYRSSENCVYDVVLKQAALMAERVSQTSPALCERRDPMHTLTLNLTPRISSTLFKEAHARCGEICAEYAKTFYLGTTLMTPKRQRAIWAIYVWCRRTDELVDGPNASHITPAALDQWEQRLEDIFRGRPYDMLDAALAHAVAKFPVDIQPFRDMIKGMRMDLVKTRYENFDELYLYCYYVAGTVGLISVPVMGIDPQSSATTESVYNAALALGIANQLTNILRDVGEDAVRGRIYLPKEELLQFGLSEEDIFARKVTDQWRAFMRYQIKRARIFFDQAEKGVVELHKDSRWPVETYFGASMDGRTWE